MGFNLNIIILPLGLCPRAMKGKLWKPLLWGQYHGSKAPQSRGNTHRSPIMGKYLPTLGAVSGNWLQLSKLPARFFSHLFMWLEHGGWTR